MVIKEEEKLRVSKSVRQECAKLRQGPLQDILGIALDLKVNRSF